MAVRPRRDGPLRAVAVTADDAIDWSRTDRIDYVRTRDPKLVQAIPGRQPDWWTLRPLSAPQAAYCASHEPPLSYQLAFCLACQDCSNASLGLSWEGAGADRQVASVSLSKLPDQVWTELGKLALDLGRVSVGEVLRFALPPGSRVMETPPSATTATYAPANSSPAGPKG